MKPRDMLKLRIMSENGGNAIPPSRSSGLARSAGTVSAGVFLSRIFGLVREQTFAYVFGAGLANDAFVVAFRIPNLLRDLFAEGAFSSAFVPTFAEVSIKKGREEAFRLANKAANALTLILAVISLIGILISPWLVPLFAPGFGRIPGKLPLTIHLTQIMFPFLLFIGLAALTMGVLNTFRKFSIPALAPCLLNLAMILAGYFLCPLFGKAPESQIYGMAIGALLGGLFQFLFQVPTLFKEGFRYLPVLDFKDPGIRQIGGLMLPRILGLSVTQVNMFVNTILASLLAQGSVSYLNYSNRLVQLPIGLFGVAIATVVLPTVAGHAALERLDEVKKTISSALRLVFFLTLPSAVGLIVLARPIISLLYEHGRFHAVDTVGTANALGFYCIGLFAYASVRSLVPTFYSLKDAATPVKIGISCEALNLVLNLILMRSMGYRGLALATSCSACVNMGLLLFFLRRRLGSVDLKRLADTFIRVLIAALTMGGAAWFAARSVGGIHVPHQVFSLTQVLIGLVFGLAVFTGVARLLRIEELSVFIHTFIRKSRKEATHG
jgi:putative peptidoglycan lipid II flippase